MKKIVLFAFFAAAVLFAACSKDTEVIEIALPDIPPEKAVHSSPVSGSAEGPTAALTSEPAAESEQPPATTAEPTETPEPMPTEKPTPIPTAQATAAPTEKPTPIPTARATAVPTEKPTPIPTAQVTATPMEKPEIPPADAGLNGGESASGNEILKLVNSHRSDAGQGSLSYSGSMQRAADIRAAECVSSFSHTRPDGSSCVTALSDTGLSYTAFGENIFMISGVESVSAKTVVDSWMASSGHKQNILSPNYTEMAIGIAKSGSSIYVAQLFGDGIR